MEEEKKLARERAAVILEVRSGKLTATGGRGAVRVSRKTYYEWRTGLLRPWPKPWRTRPLGDPLPPWIRRRRSFKGK